MPDRPRLTFFLDVDNTLLDNDAAKAEMNRELAALLGDEGAADFWRTYEEIRAEETVVDIPTTIARFCERRGEPERRFCLADLFMTFDFRRFLFPDALAVLARLRSFGKVAILSDGDPLYQTAKIHRAGLADAVEGHVAVYPHKDEHLTELSAAFPADRFIFIDDKPTVLQKIAAAAPFPLATIFIRQGKYARSTPPGFSPTRAFDSLSELLSVDFWTPGS
jgi:FMN phosphatase YigB (HAD superfamily)